MHAFVLMMVSMDGLPNQNSLPMCKYHKGPALTLILSSVFHLSLKFCVTKMIPPKETTLQPPTKKFSPLYAQINKNPNCSSYLNILT